MNLYPKKTFIIELAIHPLNIGTRSSTGKGAANTRHRHEMARSSVISYTSKCIRVTATPGYTADEDAEAEMRKTEGGGCEPVENIQIEQC
ncbi:hypothetical protein QE152_g33024 [Popillia japonica]|uniref:Uncharacterized protein n=1 Tax=Popillia japonica TaxID=7064 RepID=A0AAW1IXQ9_POPJA